MDSPQFLPLAGLLKEETVVAIVAPAIAGQFGKDVTLDQLREALVRVGFTDMIEVAMAADILSLKEAMEFNHHVNKVGDFMITSCCCPVWVTLLKRVYNDLIPDFSPSVSPMVAMGRIVKKLTPGAKVVFVGPCVAKKSEAKEKDIEDAVDYVLTFQELQLIFEALHIEPDSLAGLPAIDYASTGGRLYARTGGVSQAVFDIVDQMYPNKRDLFKAVSVDGVKDCRTMLEQLERGEVRASFIEGMGCPGGCVGGPKANIDREQGRVAANEAAYDSAIKIPVNSEVLEETLRQLGIKHREELMEKASMFEREF
jgi:ferredoxin hydrogenase